MINVTKSSKIHATIIIDQFIDRVLLSKKRRSVYYNVKQTIPDRVHKKLESGDYSTAKDGTVIDVKTGLKVLKNVQTAGKEKYMKIAGQDLWVGIDHHLRSKLAREMKIFFYDYIRDIKPIINIKDYPIGVGIEIMDAYDDGDIDNMEHIYRKVLHDALCGNIEFIKGDDGKFTPDRKKYRPIIIDDSKQYIQEIWTKFIPIQNHEDRKMTIIIYSL